MVRRGEGASGALEGSYDLDGNTISGTVLRVPHVRNGVVTVQAWRGSVLATECFAGPDTGSRRIPFAMKLGDHFTIGELAREAVIITAKNARGDTGRLTMNGSTQLELIRDHLAVPSETVFDLSFGHGGNARPFLGSGWSGSEATATWTIGAESYIYFDHSAVKADYRLRLRYRAYLAPFVRIQAMTIDLNDSTIAAFSENVTSLQFREFKVHWSHFGSGSRSVIRIHHPNAVIPRQHTESADDRCIAFAFERMALVRLID